MADVDTIKYTLTPPRLPDARPIIKNLLSLIAGVDGKAAPTRKFCKYCEGGLHDSPYAKCPCPCHPAWAYLEQHGDAK